MLVGAFRHIQPDRSLQFVGLTCIDEVVALGAEGGSTEDQITYDFLGHKWGSWPSMIMHVQKPLRTPFWACLVCSMPDACPTRLFCMMVTC